MGFLRRLADRFDPKVEQRDSWDNMASATGLPVASSTVNPRSAENLSTVLACVNAISTALSALPANVYRTSADNVRKESPEHPLDRLIRRGPNRWQTWPDFVEFWIAQTLLRGNGLVEIVSDTRGHVVELIPYPWDWVTVQLLPSGRVAYDVCEMYGYLGGKGRRKRLLSGEVLHLRDRTDEGIVGRSRLQRGAAVVSAASGLYEFAGSLYQNGIYPSGILTPEMSTISPEQATILRDSLKAAFQGPKKAGAAMILPLTMKWQSLAMSPEDAELLESRRFTTEEICRLYQVPPQIVQDHSRSTFTNSETAGRWFAQFCLLPWVRKIEAEFARSLFTSGRYSLELDMGVFDRGDPAQRWNSYGTAVDKKILTPDEIRELEGWNPREAAQSA